MSRPIPLRYTLEDIQGKVPRVEWEEFVSTFQWNQGEHMAFIGPTGSGKTTLALPMLNMRKYVTILATKPKDSTLKKFEEQNGYKLLKKWKPSLSVQKYPKRILWPDAKSLNADENQQKEFDAAMKYIYRSGGWCLYIDELWYIIHMLKMPKHVKMFLQQFRSIHGSLVVATQRPAFIPLEVYDQSTHLFFWRDNDERNLKRISGIGWNSSHLILNLVANLEKHEVLYINTRDDTMMRFIPPEGGKK